MSNKLHICLSGVEIGFGSLLTEKNDIHDCGLTEKAFRNNNPQLLMVVSASISAFIRLRFTRLPEKKRGRYAALLIVPVNFGQFHFGY